MDKYKVRALHEDVNHAMAEVAARHGFVFKPGRMTYSDADVHGRVRFVLASMAGEVVNRGLEAHGLAFKVGDVVTNGRGVQQTVVDVTTRGNVITQDGQGKRWRCKPWGLRKAESA